MYSFNADPTTSLRLAGYKRSDDLHRSAAHPRYQLTRGQQPATSQSGLVRSQASSTAKRVWRLVPLWRPAGRGPREGPPRAPRSVRRRRKITRVLAALAVGLSVALVANAQPASALQFDGLVSIVGVDCFASGHRMTFTVRSADQGNHTYNLHYNLTIKSLVNGSWTGSTEPWWIQTPVNGYSYNQRDFTGNPTYRRVVVSWLWMDNRRPGQWLSATESTPFYAQWSGGGDRWLTPGSGTCYT